MTKDTFFNLLNDNVMAHPYGMPFCPHTPQGYRTSIPIGCNACKIGLLTIQPASHRDASFGKTHITNSQKHPIGMHLMQAKTPLLNIQS